MKLLETYLRTMHADQGGGATFDDWLQAVARDPGELGHAETLVLLRYRAGEYDADLDSLDVGVYEHEEIGWVAVEEDNSTHNFDNENEACAFQRGYRVANGLDPMTGERS